MWLVKKAEFLNVSVLKYHDAVDDIQGVVMLSLALAEEPEDHIQAAAAWSLGQIGRHTPEHSKAVAQANVFPRLLQCYTRTGASEDLQTKVSYWVWTCIFLASAP